jgi:hypothetical protein
MTDRFNKPRVFLSHSSTDRAFIEKLAIDLRKCQIEPWLDKEEIRDGRPWLKEIFECGIAVCDAVVIYFTEQALNSNMVEKEVDAAQLQQLSDVKVSILPYVSQADLRERLRLDLRSLQCRVWNTENYSDVLPSVVAEIWRSYMERLVGTATLREKNKRLELELELKRVQEKYNSSVFLPSEDRDFDYIRQMLDRQVEVIIPIYEQDSTKEFGRDVFNFSLLNALVDYVNAGYEDFGSLYLVNGFIDKVQQNGYPLLADTCNRQYRKDALPSLKVDVLTELKTYGLAKATADNQRMSGVYRYQFTDKMYRFVYWLGYNNYYVAEVSYEYLGQLEPR